MTHDEAYRIVQKIASGIGVSDLNEDMEAMATVLLGNHLRLQAQAVLLTAIMEARPHAERG